MWEILNSNLSIAFISIIVTTFTTIKIIEGKKTRDKRKILLGILRYELISYSKPIKNDNGGNYRSPHRDKVVWSILTSDILNRKKDKILISHLYELIGWIENYNSMNNLANLSIVYKNEDVANFFANGREILYNKGFEEKDKILYILKNSYNIK